MNWTNPETLDLESGKNDTSGINAIAIFHSKCSQCHHVFKDMTGPALKDFNLRGPWKNPLNTLAWLSNTGGFMAKDQYTKELKAKFGSIMTPFPDMSLEFVIALSKYVNEVTPEQFEKNESLYRPKPIRGTPITPEQDCGSDTVYYSSMVEDFAEYDTSIPPAILNTSFNKIDPEWEDNLQEYFNELDRQRFEFKIEDNGWYNIDAFLKPDKEIKNVRLQVKVNSTEKMPFTTLLFVPSKRVILESTGRDQQLYKFIYNADRATLPLSVGHRAIAMTFGSVKDKLMYGISEFTINTDQTIKIELKETTKEKFKNILQSKNIEGVTLEAIEKEQVIIPRPCNQESPSIQPKAKKRGPGIPL